MATMAAQVTAAPVEIELAGRKYLLSPLRDRDYVEFEQWVQDRYMALARRSVTGLAAEDRQALLRHAYDQAGRITMGSPEARQVLRSIAGATRILWMGLRRNHPALTEEELQALLEDPVTLAGAVERMNYVNSSADGGGSGEQKKSPADQ